MLVMAVSDVLTLNFFWMVRDEGSWLDIGTSISHFCIASMLCVFVAGLEFLSEVFASGVEVGVREVEGKAGNDVVREKGIGETKSLEGNGSVGAGKAAAEDIKSRIT